MIGLLRQQLDARLGGELGDAARSVAGAPAGLQRDAAHGRGAQATASRSSGSGSAGALRCVRVVGGDDVQEELAVAGRAGVSGLAGAEHDAARIRGGTGDALEHRGVDLGVAHDALAHVVLAGLELRLDHRQQAVRPREQLDERRQHERERDERDVDDGQRGRRAGEVAGRQEAGVDALQHGHAVVGAETLVQLAAADVERRHVRRTALQKAVGEAAGGGADVDAREPGDVDAEGVERGRQLVAAARDERRPLLDLQLGASA